MKTVIFIAITEDGKVRQAFGAHDDCDAIRKANNHFSSCYYNWEIIRQWQLN